MPGHIRQSRWVRQLVKVLLFAGATALYGQQAAHPPEPAQGHSPAEKNASRLHDFLGLAAPPDPAAAERGGKLFLSSCAFCHGAKATGGDTGPDLVRSSLVLHDGKGELIGPVVRNGRPDRGMPRFSSFSDPQLSDIAAFLHLRVELTANRGTYQVADVITGNAKAGELWFRGPGACTTCHSPTGDLAHVGSRFSPAEIQARMLYPEPAEMKGKNVTVVLPTGKRVAGTLKRLDDFRVSFLDTDGLFQSIDLDANTRVLVEDPLKAHRDLLTRYTDADMHNVTAYLASLK